MDVNSPLKGNETQFEVTGVSRSGRVRKKSYKLMDFQSADSSPPPKPKKPPGSTGNGRGRPRKDQSIQKPSKSDDDDEYIMSGENDTADMEDDEEYLSASSDDDDDDLELDEDLDDIDYVDEVLGGSDPAVRQSLYMIEKSNKRKIMKNGKVMFGKTNRKDKGKSRFTAYMLWSKEIRKQITATQPNIDFPTLSRRTGDLWASVPKSEKIQWRRKAKRLGSKQKKSILKEALNPSTPNIYKSNSSTFMSRTTTTRTKKIGETNNMQLSPPLSNNNSSNIFSQMKWGNAFKVNGTAPVDVAAHLRLLGENLTVIGERLKVHESNVAVTGSLSVLLDSLICSLGPLMCLTTLIPGLDEQSLKDNLQNTLDNIAYVMPGL